MREKVTPYLALVAMVGSGFAVIPLGNTMKVESTDRAGLNAHETHASASLLGQFRTSLSSWLWLRTDLYLHNGVEMRTLSKQELASGKKGVGGSETGEDRLHDDTIIVTVIPDKSRDFRGWMGDVERATKAYKDMTNHGHNDPETALPLFRLMTWADPQFTPGWLTGATVMGRRKTDEGFDKAIAFLKEGLEKNPNNVGILGELGRFYAGKKKDFTKAIPYLERAIALPLPKAVDEEWAEHYASAFRWAALSYRETGQFEKQRATAAHGLRLMPDDPVLVRMLGEPPYILTPEAQDEWLREQVEKTDPADEDEHHHHDHDHDHDHDHGHDHDHEH